MEIETPANLVCALGKECIGKKIIEKGDVYYLLGGGTVVTCQECACNSSYTIIVNKKPVHMQRGWDKVDKYVCQRIQKTL